MPRALLERRTIKTEIEARAKGSKIWIEGYGAVFNKRSANLGGFVEEVEPPAFNKTIKEADIRSLQNHDPNLVLGRLKAGTLELSVDNTGLYYRAQPPSTQYARDLLELLDRRDVDQSSFQFWKIHDRWTLAEDGLTPVRHLEEVGLLEVSVVTFPAYEDATSGIARNAALDGLAKRSGLAIIDLVDEEAIRKAILEGKEPSGSTKEPSSKDTQDDKDTRQRELRAELEKARSEYANADSWLTEKRLSK